jgi:Tfp pilus assembly protein PilF
VEVRNAAGLLQLHFGRADQAAQQFRAAADADAKNAESWFNLSRAQLQLNQTAAARESLDKAVAAQPDSLPAQAALAHLEVAAGNVDSALRRVESLKSSMPDNPGVLVLSGDVLTVARRPAEALKDYRAAYAQRADLGIAGKFYRVATMARLPQSTELLDRWLKAHPDDAAARALLAEAALQQGERSRAINEYRAVLERQPNDPVALNNLAWLYHEAGDSRALELARRAAKAAPQAPGVLDTLGWILVEQGKVSEGLEHLAKAISGPKVDPEVRYHYAAALAKAGRGAESRPQLEQALSGGHKFPSRAAAEQLLTQLRSASASPNQ